MSTDGNGASGVSGTGPARGYASICAMESTSKLDDEPTGYCTPSSPSWKWQPIEKILYWIPLRYEVKVLFVAWLVMPQLRGASFIYEKYTREQLRKHGVRLHEHHGHGHGAEHRSHVLKAENRMH